MSSFPKSVLRLVCNASTNVIQSSNDGLYLLFSMRLTVWRVTPICFLAKIFFVTFLKFLDFLFLGSDLKLSTGWFEPTAGSIV